LTKWKQGFPANPAVRLDKSGLTVIDIDAGAESLDDVLAWMKRNDIPDTLIVASGRTTFGCHLYFSGTRVLPDVQPNRHLRIPRKGFELDGIRGDIKCHGHVVIAGGLHKSGSTYTVVHDRPIAPLPEWLKVWEERSVKEAKAKHQEKVDRAIEGSTPETFNLVPSGKRHQFLFQEASHLYWRGLDEETIYTSMVQIATRYCEDGKNYVARKEANLRTMVKWIASQPRTRFIRPHSGKVIVTAPEPTPRQILMGWLTARFQLGERVSIHTIMVRFDTDHPGQPHPSRVTLGRAMKGVDFKEVGKDPADKRQPLWARLGRPK
jgi:hypothetical protein